jgi:hypothetical protein
MIFQIHLRMENSLNLCELNNNQSVINHRKINHKSQIYIEKEH